MEMVLMGIAGCTAMDVISIMRKKRADMTGFQVNISGERADDHPKRYTKIFIEFVLKESASLRRMWSAPLNCRRPSTAAPSLP